MQSKVAVITTVRDDDFFLKKWVDYYGGFFGKDALYVINHGDQPAVREIAAGCNLFPIPDTDTKNFNIRRWRTQNGLLAALRQWYAHVIVCDVDEFIVVDPETGHDLGSWLLDVAKPGKVRTAMGLEILHLRDREPEGVDTSILGPRRHAQLNPWYSKPCIISRASKLSRGGHYATWDKLEAPDFLYLFHMKYCDFDQYVDMLNRRRDMVKAAGLTEMKEKRTKAVWFEDERDDAAVFAPFMEREVDESWDFRPYRKHMQDTWAPRNNALYHFKRKDSPKLFKLPERFSGIV
jgi:hypothetical protein